jgi:hypothetical protein
VMTMRSSRAAWFLGSPRRSTFSLGLFLVLTVFVINFVNDTRSTGPIISNHTVIGLLEQPY